VVVIGLPSREVVLSDSLIVVEIPSVVSSDVGLSDSAAAVASREVGGLVSSVAGSSSVVVLLAVVVLLSVPVEVGLAVSVLTSIVAPPVVFPDSPVVVIILSLVVSRIEVVFKGSLAMV